jgi:hypothetical protein
MNSAIPGEARPAQAAGSALIERDREVTAIPAALDAGSSGAGRVLIIEGEAGTGKTRLLAEAAGLADARVMRCLRARRAARGRLPVRGDPPAARAGACPARRRRAGGDLAGAANSVGPMLSGAATRFLPPQDALFALVHGIYWVCARLSEDRPTLLAVDDIQWADQPSAGALEYLGQRAEELSLALLLTARRGESTGAFETIAGLRPRA